MDIITLRRFRDTVAAIEEPVMVQVTDRATGRIRMLGQWTPASRTTGLDGLAAEVDAGRGDTVASDALKSARTKAASLGALVPPRRPSADKVAPFRPVPKPGAKR